MNKNIGTLATIGNQARNKALSPMERKTLASKAAKARWAYKSHVCGELCRCRNCNCFKFRHLTKETCFLFECVSLPPTKII